MSTRYGTSLAADAVVVRPNFPTALAVTATAVVAALLVLLVVIPRDANTPAAASATPTASATSTATSTASPSPSPTASPTAAASGRYVSVALGYAIETPPPWRRGDCTSGSFTNQGIFYANDVFVPVSAIDETGTDVGFAFATVRVAVEDNPEKLSPRQWAERGRTLGGTAGQRHEDVTYAGRPATKKSYPNTPLAAYFVANGTRMYVVAAGETSTSDPAMRETIVRMVESFRFLTDAELAAARSASPRPLPPRSPEALADALAAAFAAKNADAMVDLLAACVTTGAEQAGASFVSRDRYVRDLRTAFANGLVVTVRPRPFEGDRASNALMVGSTWEGGQSAGIPPKIRERKMMLRRGDNDRWEWHGTLERLF